jgi:hypothetical protein
MPYTPPSTATPDTNLLTVGEGICRREDVSNKTAALTSGTARFSYFTARKTEAITQLRVISGDTAAGATPTLCKLGVYLVNADATLTQLAVTANDTTLWAATNTAYTRTLLTTVNKVAGVRYAVGFLVVTTATAPNAMGSENTPQTAEMTIAPRMCSLLTGQTDLQASITPANGGTRPYAVLLP